MKKNKNMKKWLAAIALLTVVASITTGTVIACSSKGESQEQKIVNTIKNIEFKWENATTKNKVADIVKKINETSFIHDQLPEDIKEIFNKNLFQLNKITKEDGTEIIDSDFHDVKILQTKINFNYGLIENQETNLRITIIDGRISLSDKFRDFQFKDSRNVKGFVDNNNSINIKNQIQAFLQIENLENENLILTNPESNTIVLKAEKNSDNYQGEVRLTWNLKLFEIWGTGVTGVSHPLLFDGLKGYFYLDLNGKIKYFDVFDYLAPKSAARIHSSYLEYHSFEFLTATGTQLKQYIFNGKLYNTQIEHSFGQVNFESNMMIKVTSPEIYRVKIFQNNQWLGIERASEFVINSKGEISSRS